MNHANVPIFCSLLPVELLEAAGLTPRFLEGDALFRESSGACLFHDNLCPYVKALHEYLSEHQDEFGLIVIPTACDAQKKLFNACRTTIDHRKLFLLDFPHVKTEGAVQFLAAQYRRLLCKCATLPLTPSPRGRGMGKGIETPPEDGALKKIAIIGSNLPLKVVTNLLGQHGYKPAFLNHCLEKGRAANEGCKALMDASLVDYARYTLSKNSCPRTIDNGYKKELAEKITNDGFLGLIAVTFKFCDFQPFDYLYLKGLLPSDFPILLLEHEGRTENEGQIMTRVEAFLEKLKGKRKKEKVGEGDKSLYFVGIDSGSHATKLVCIDKDGGIIFHKVVPTGTSIQKSSESLMLELMKQIGRKDNLFVTATGYGRNQVQDCNDKVTEITCHAKGVYHRLRRGGTIIDIGGQDSKAIYIGKSGEVIRFAMNDKCAAGTGRFLEVISDRLGVSLEEFAELALQSKEVIPISNMCTVFAESEVISMLAKGHSTKEIAKGIHKAIAERTASLVRRIDGAPPYFMTGGVAKNRAIVGALSHELGNDVHVVEEPQFSGALGAALISRER